MVKLNATAHRVAQHTSDSANHKIQAETNAHVSSYTFASREAINKRLKELDREWDIERALETNGSALLLIGLFLGVTFKRRFLLLPALVGGFCLQHALQGWCPPIEVFRRLGVRTTREIEDERVALKALRGDFKNQPKNAAAALAAARR